MEALPRENLSQSQQSISASACSSRELSRRSSDTLNGGSMRHSFNFSEMSEHKITPLAHLGGQNNGLDQNQSGQGDSINLQSPEKLGPEDPDYRRLSKRDSDRQRSGDEQPLFGHFASGPRQFASKERLARVGAFSPLSRQRSDTDQPKLHAMDIAEFYKEEREKLNVWTYLFSNLARSLRMMLTMCELEGKTEFCQGVVDMLGNGIKDFQALSHKIKLEEDCSGKVSAWDINQKSLSTQNRAFIEEYKNYAQDITEEEELEFTLLNRMVSTGRMSFYEAVVLIIRERALLIEEARNQASQETESSESAEELANKTDVSKKDETPNSDRSKSRSRSFTRNNNNKVDFGRLKKRVEFNCKFLQEWESWGQKDEDSRIEELESRQRRALGLRELQKLKIKQRGMKIEEKVELLKKKREEEDEKRIEELKEKVEAGYQRGRQHIDKIKLKAREPNLKAKEIFLLSTLENDVRKITIDQKLQETHQRRIEILRRRTQKHKKLNTSMQTVIMRKEEIDNEKKSLLQSKLDKQELASKRRAEILSHRAKRAKHRRAVVRKQPANPFRQGIDSLKMPLNLAVDLEEFEVRTCPEKSNYLEHDPEILTKPYGKPKARAKSLTTLDIDFVDLASTFKLYKPKSKTAPSKPKERPKYRNLEQILVGKPASNMPILGGVGSKKTTLLEVKTKKEGPASGAKKLGGNLAVGLTESRDLQKEKDKDKKKLAGEKHQANGSSAGVVGLMSDKTTNQPTLLANQPMGPSGLTVGLMGTESPKKKAPLVLGPSTPFPSYLKNIGNSLEDLASPRLVAKEQISTNEARDAPLLLAHGSPKGSQLLTSVDQKIPSNLVPEAKKLSLNTTASKAGQTTVAKEAALQTKQASAFGVESTLTTGSPPMSPEPNLQPRPMVRLCTLCDMMLIEEVTNEQHLQSKAHKKLKNQFNLTGNEERLSIITCQPTELASNRVNALKKKCKRIRQTLGAYSLKHEALALGKENALSPNKTRLHSLTKELTQLLSTQTKDFKLIDTNLHEVQKILSGTHNENDLHILRANKFLSQLVEICKLVNIVHKNDHSCLLRALDTTAQLLYSLCSVKDNRTYMLKTNRVIPLVDLLLWSWNNTAKYVYCLNYIPLLFHLIGFLLKHKLPDQTHDPSQNCKAPVVEYVIYCGLLLKLKQRFTSFSDGLDLTYHAGKIPLALLKAISLLDVVTTQLQTPCIPFSSTSKTLNESISFLLKETDIAGVLELMGGLLLFRGPSKKRKEADLLPQTIFSVVMLITKIFSNIGRLEITLLQEVLGSFHNIETFYHCMMYILDYCINNFENHDEIPELLNEAILVLGYFCYLNPAHQDLLSRGVAKSTLVEKLSQLPYNYFFTNTMESDVLFPTLLCVVYNHQKNLKLLLKDMSLSLLVEYLKRNMEVVDNYSVCKQGEFNPGSLLPPREEYAASRSASSATSSANSVHLAQSEYYHFLLPWRFAVEHWRPALHFLSAADDL